MVSLHYTIGGNFLWFTLKKTLGIELVLYHYINMLIEDILK